MGESIETIERSVVTVDGRKYSVLTVKHVRNGVYSLNLKRERGKNQIWCDVLVENNRIIYVDLP